MMFRTNAKMISATASIEGILRILTPLLIVKFNLQHILHNNRCDFKPQLKSDNMLELNDIFGIIFLGIL